MTLIGDSIMLLWSSSPAVSMLAKATLVLTLGLLGTWLTRRRRAAVRHAILASSFAVLLALPVASALIDPVSIALPVSTRDLTPPALFLALTDDAPPAVTPEGGIVAAPPAPRWGGLSRSTVFLAVWLVGMAFFLLRMIFGLQQVRALRQSAPPWRDGQPVVDTLALEAGIYRPLDVLLHESLPAPVTCGVFRPSIMLPPDAQHWGVEDLNRAIVHELEHVRRFDWASHCLARVGCAVYWFHPLVWSAWRQLTLEAERSCDDAVLARSEATAYADQLVGLARRLSVAQPPVLAMASRSDLSARVGSLLDAGRARGRAGALLAAVAGAAVAAIVLSMSPLQIVAAPQAAAAVAVQNIPGWDAVSIKPCTESPGVRQAAPNNTSTDRLTLRCTTLVNLIFSAYTTYEGGRYNGQMSGVVRYDGFPEWTRTERYAIEAKAEGNPGRPMMLGPMLQKILEDRFRLKVHTETKEGPVYILSVAKDGPKMQSLEPGGCAPVDLNALVQADNLCPVETHFQAPNFTWDVWTDMESLTRRLTALFADPSVADTPVINRTGLEGAYHVHMVYTNPFVSADQSADVPSGPSVFSALQKLGLKLDPGKGPRRYLVFDHADKTPSGN